MGLGANLELGKTLCLRGHAALASGQSPREWLLKAQELAASCEVGPDSALGRAVSALVRATQAFETDPAQRLLCGWLPEDLPPGLRRRLEGLRTT